MTTRLPHAFVLSIVSEDRPGVLAAVSDALVELDGNIDSCGQTIVEGYFSLLIVVSFLNPIEPSVLAERVRRRVRAEHVTALPFRAPTLASAKRENLHVITVVGRDRPGIVRRLTDHLATRDINITDLFGRPQGEDVLFVCEVHVPPQCRLAELQADLYRLGREIGVSIHIQPESVFAAPTELRRRD
jgi:glycine cleavage system transcriptional repressor